MTSKHPPHPPEVRRGLRISIRQAIGMAAIAVIPVLAAAGALEHEATERAESAGLELTVRYPALVRLLTLRAMTIEVVNRGTTTRDSVGVVLDPALLDRYAEIQHAPELDGRGSVPLGAIGPGETRRATVQLRAASPGSHRGTVAVHAPGGGPTVSLRVRILP
jgi:hypothetical protein